MIVDIHAHVDEVPSLGWSMRASDLIAQMDEANVDRTAISTIVDAPSVNPNALELIADAIDRHRPRLLGFIRVHPWYNEAEQLVSEAVEAYGFVGIKLHPVTNLSRPAGEATKKIVNLAADLDVPVLFHSGDENFVTPFEFAELASSCPNTKIILAHLGGYAHSADAVEVADEFSNVYLDTSAMPYPSWIRSAVDRLGADRILFGSDAPGCSPAVERYKVHLADLSDSVEKQILGLNSLRILNMEL